MTGEGGGGRDREVRKGFAAALQPLGSRTVAQGIGRAWAKGTHRYEGNGIITDGAKCP